MHEGLKRQVLEANLELVSRGLVHASFGNVSGLDRESGIVAIKPSGVPYAVLCTDDLSLVRLDDGELLDGLRPSSDTPTHLELYRAFDAIAGIAHTHSTWATSWAQAGRAIPCFGTTHADSFNGPVPCTRRLEDDECRGAYERLTGAAIVEAMAGKDPLELPAALVALDGPLGWGTSAMAAVVHAEALELVARLAFNTVALDDSPAPVPAALLERHFRRKHGPTAYYGQGAR